MVFNVNNAFLSLPADHVRRVFLNITSSNVIENNLHQSNQVQQHHLPEFGTKRSAQLHFISSNIELRCCKKKQIKPFHFRQFFFPPSFSIFRAFTQRLNQKVGLRMFMVRKNKTTKDATLEISLGQIRSRPRTRTKPACV